MRAKKILLLSCLYPLILFLVIGYTFDYSSKKTSVTALQQNVNLFDISFTSPVPTTIILPTNVLKPEASSRAADIQAEVTAITEPTAKEVNASATISATVIPTSSTLPQSFPQLSPTPTIYVRNIPTPVLPQNAINVKSVKIVENASTAIVPDASSVIIESENVVSP